LTWSGAGALPAAAGGRGASTTSRAEREEKRKKLNTTILPRRARRHAELDRLDVDVKLIFM